MLNIPVQHFFHLSQDIIECGDRMTVSVERQQHQTKYDILTRQRDQLNTSNINLTRERDDLERRICSKFKHYVKQM